MIYIYILKYILLNTLDQLPGEWPARFTCADWAGGRGFEGGGGTRHEIPSPVTEGDGR